MDYVDNFISYVTRKAQYADIYLNFDRYYDYSIKSVKWGARRGKHATHLHNLDLAIPLLQQKVVLQVHANKIQLIDIIW